MDQFWLVWSPQGARPPLVRHRTYRGAVSEAERLARLNPGSEFFVVQALSVSMVAANVTVPLRVTWQDDMDIPF